MTTLPVKNCKLCMQGVLGLSDDRSQREWSEIFDIARSSVQRHIKHVEDALREGTLEEYYVEDGPKHREPEPEDEDDDEMPSYNSLADDLGIPMSAVTSRTVGRWGNGSSERITYRPNKEDAQKALLNYDDISDIIDSMERAEPPEEGYSPHTMVVLVADLQVGKTDQLGGTDELVKRVMRSFEAAALRAERERPDAILLVDLGDVIENFKNTKSQRQTNDLNLTSQIRTARKILAKGIQMLSPYTNQLVVISVPSNHCQVREDYGDPASTPNDDFGLDINHALEDQFSGRPEASHVSFIRPSSIYSEVVVLDLGELGGVVGFVHGHQAKTQVKVPEWFKGQVHGQRNGMDKVTTLFYGHFHNMKMEQSGAEKWVIGAPTSDAGSSWYTNTTGEQSTNGVLVLNLSGNGRWSNLEIV